MSTIVIHGLPFTSNPRGISSFTVDVPAIVASALELTVLLLSESACSVVEFPVMEESCDVNESVMGTGAAGVSTVTCERSDALGGNKVKLNESDKECESEESTSAALDGNVCRFACRSATVFGSTGKPGSIDTIGLALEWSVV